MQHPRVASLGGWGDTGRGIPRVHPSARSASAAGSRLSVNICGREGKLLLYSLAKSWTHCLQQSKIKPRLGGGKGCVMAQACSPSSWEVEAGRSEVKGYKWKPPWATRDCLRSGGEVS